MTVIVFAIAMVILCIIINLKRLRIKGKEQLKRWASVNDLTILYCEQSLFGSPLWITMNTASQTVFRVAFGDPKNEDKIRLARVRVGHWMWGMRVEKVDVRWDGPWQRFSEQETPAAVENPMTDRWIDG